MKTTNSSAFLLFISLALILLASVIVGLTFTFPFDSNTPGIYLSVLTIVIIAFAAFVLHTYIVEVISIIVEHIVEKHTTSILTDTSHLRSLFNTTVKSTLDGSNKFLKDFGVSVNSSNEKLLKAISLLAGLEKRLQEGEVALKNTSELYQRKVSKLADKQKALDERLQKISDETLNVIKIDVTGVEDEDERFILVRAAVKEYYAQQELKNTNDETSDDLLNEQREKDLVHLEDNHKVSSDDKLALSPGQSDEEIAKQIDKEFPKASNDEYIGEE